MRKVILTIALAFLTALAIAQPANDNCTTAQNLGTLATPPGCVGTAAVIGAATTVNGTLVGATEANPYIYQSSCVGGTGTMAIPANDVWYTFTASAYTGVFTVNSSFPNPNIAMYSGTCGALGGGVGGCAISNGTGSVTLTVEQMVIGTTYYLQVSGNTGETGTFTLSAQNNKDCADCLTNSTLTVNPLPVNGAYNPGTTVNFCYHVGNYTHINTNWLHGVQLNFGNGWNPATLTPVSASAVSTNGSFLWFPNRAMATSKFYHPVQSDAI